MVSDARMWPRLRERLRSEGVLLGSAHLAYTFARRHLADFRIWTVTRTDATGSAGGPTPDPDVRWATAADADSCLAALFPSAGRRIAAGDRIAILEDNGRVVAIDCFATGEFGPLDWLVFGVGKNETFGYWNYVVPECRGRGLSGRCSRFALRGLACAGYPRNFAVVDTFNRKARRAFAKVGSRPVGRIRRQQALDDT